MAHKILTVLSTAVALLVATPALAITSTAVADFDNPTARLVKHHQHLFAFTEADAGGITVFAANRHGENWKELSDDTPVISDLVADTSSIDKFGVFRGKVYLAAQNNDGLSQIWRICTHCRPAVWEAVGEAGFDEEVSSVQKFVHHAGTFYAFVNSASGAGVFSTADGEAWSQVGEFGLGLDVTSVTAATRWHEADIHYLYVGTATGEIYRANVADAATWELVTTLADEITAMLGHGQYLTVAVTDGTSATVVQSKDGTNFSSLGEVGLGNVNNSRVTGFGLRRNGLHALTENASDGAEVRIWDRINEEWDVVVEGGFDNTDNTASTHLLWYHGKRYVATTNSTDGAYVYRLTKE